MQDFNFASKHVARQFYSSLPCGLVHFAIHDGTITVHDINRACWKICGYPSKQSFLDAVHEHIDAVIHPADRAQFSRLAQQVMRTGSARMPICASSVTMAHALTCIKPWSVW